jgi:uncharacterized membrane protein YgcG
MTQPFDLKTFIKLQREYANDLGGIATSSNTDRSDAASAISTLGTKLGYLDNALNNSNADTNALLLQQNSVNNILNTENERLESKKANIDNAITGQKRLMQLNDTYRKRYSAYINLVLIIVLALIIIIVLIFINKVFPFIPEFVYTLLYIIILSGTAIYCWIVITDIQKRDKFDYDKHTRPAPTTPDELKKNAEAAAKAGNLLASVDAALGCKSEACCATGTTYDASLNKCIIPGSGSSGSGSSGSGSSGSGSSGSGSSGSGSSGSGSSGSGARAFTTIQQAYSQEPELRKTVEPYTPCEFEGYSKL